MKKLLIAFSFFILHSSFFILKAQNVAINNTGNQADPSAGLDVSFNNKGLLPPRMTDAQMNTIAHPAKGLLVMDTTTNCLMMYSGSSWQSIYCACTGAPATPGAITGSGAVCSGTSAVIYSVAVVFGANSYTWNVPAGASITAGQGTPSVKVTFGSSSGNISVTATNNCGTSAANTLAVTVVTSMPTLVSATASPNPVCAGNTLTLTGSATGATSWSWSGPGGYTSTLQSPAIANITTVSAGTFTLTASNVCGSPTATTAPVTVNAYTPGSQTFNYSGSVQTFTVPCGVSAITISAYGAQGGNGCCSGPSGGYGAYVYGTIPVNTGNILDIMAGQQGGSYNGGAQGGSAGGGGSYVWNVSASNTLLIVAGGGGGGGDRPGVNPGIGSSTISITTGSGGSGTGSGGTGGNGGNGGVLEGNTTYVAAGGGAGWLSNGTAGASGIYSGGGGGYSPSNGGAGGTAAGGGGATGGYGGGGGGAEGGGGGGGYNGGGGGNGWNGSQGGPSGGGSSYIISAALNTGGTSGYQSGNGQVIITW